MNRPRQMLEQLSEFLSVDELLSDDIEVYPNPTDDIIRINGDVIGCEIYNIVGKRVKSVWTNVEEIRVSDLQSGIYMIRLFVRDGNVVTKKIIKK